MPCGGLVGNVNENTGSDKNLVCRYFPKPGTYNLHNNTYDKNVKTFDEYCQNGQRR